MSYRIHTADPALVEVQVDVVRAIDEALGYEYTEEEFDDRRLIINDMGNQEAWVFTGTEDQWRTIAEAILGIVDRRNGAQT